MGNIFKRFLVLMSIAALVQPISSFALDSATIRESISNKLDQVEDIGRYEIDIHVRRGNVILEGIVATQADRVLIENVARETPGVKEVRNGIAVQPEWSGRPGDLVRRIKARIESNPQIKGYKLDARASGTTVTLKGTANEFHTREMIEAEAQAEAGQLKVVNQITVPSGTSDQELERRVRAALAQSGQAGLDELQVAASGGIVTLSGARPNHRDIDHILSVTLMVEGVKDIRSEMRLRH